MSWKRYYRSSKAREVEGGIKAHSKRGAFGESWWARRWIAVLEKHPIKNRLQRGKRYARKGQVISITVRTGLVEAEVQGSRRSPYQVQIEFPVIDDRKWERLLGLLTDRALYAARLLAGVMPEDIQECFQEVGASLFPQRHGDIGTRCTCPDHSNPCKHIAAVYYLLGEQFDRDPFLMFRLRGKPREELMAELGERTEPEAVGGAVEPKPLPVDPELFWSSAESEKFVCPPARIPESPAEIPRRLGQFPFWRSDIRFLRRLEILYGNAAGRGLRVAAGEVAKGGDENGQK
ncbi:MAG: SWIM zinc finger family protein [Planctomycetota bacterium]